MGLITSVVGANDIVPRISWRALTYLKLLVKKALEETELKKASYYHTLPILVLSPFLF